MWRPIPIVLALLLSSPSWAQSGNSVEGDVNIRSHEPTLVSVADKARFFPGQRLTITVTGVVDVNPDEHSDCNKDAFGFCHRTYWTEHHFHSPDTVPSYFVLQRADDHGQKIEFKVGASPVTQDIPVDGAAFDRPFELLGYIAAPGTGIDTGRSTNSYSVRISVDATERVNSLPLYFASRKPTYRDFVDTRNNRQVIDRYSESQLPSLCAQFVRSYATNQFPMKSGPTAQEEQLSFLQFAKNLAPLDTVTIKALTDFFNAVGLPQEAEKTINQSISALEQRVAVGGLAKDKAALADMYIALAAMITQNRGSVDPIELSRADGIYEKAALLFAEINFANRRATTLAARATLLRRLKSVTSLRASIGLYQEARSQMALTLVGDVAVRSVDGKKIFTGTNYAGYQAIDMTSGEILAAFHRAGRDFRPVAWDSVSRRVLLQAGDTLAWHEPFTQAGPVSSFPAAGDTFRAANGTIVASTRFDGHAVVLTKTGADFRLSIGGEETCTFSPVSAPAPKLLWYGPAVLSLDGKTVALNCGSKIGASSVSDSQLTSIARLDASALDGKPRDVLGIALAPDGHSLAAITRAAVSPAVPPATAPPSASSAPSFDDRVVVWSALEAGGRFLKEFPLASELKTPQFGLQKPPPAISFSPDGTSIVVSDGSNLEFITIATGVTLVAPVKSVQQPPSIVPAPLAGPLFLAPISSIEITSGDDLVIKDPIGSKIVVVSWPSRAITSMSVSSQTVGALIFGTVITRSAQAGRQVVWIGERDFLTLDNEVSAADAKVIALAQPISVDIGAFSPPPLLLSGGRFFVSREFLGSPTTIATASGIRKTLVPPHPEDRVFSIGLNKEDQWVRVVTGPDGRFQSLESMQGTASVGEIQLPPIPNSFMQSVLSSMQMAVNDWVAHGRPFYQVPGEAFNLSNARDVEQALAHRDRLSIEWRLPLFLTTIFQLSLPETASLLAFEPMIRYRSEEGRVLTYWSPSLPRLLALVDLTKSTADAVSLTDFGAYNPIAFLDVSSALVSQVTPQPPLHWYLRSIGDGKVQPMPVSKLTAGDTQTFSGFLSYQVAQDFSLFQIIGSTHKPDGTWQFWLEPFSLQGATANAVSCSQCGQFDPSKLPDLVRAPGVPVIPQNTFEPSQATAAVRSSANLTRTMFLAGEFLEVIELPSGKVLLSTNASLPRLVEQNVAVVQDSRHLLKIYSLSR